MKMRKLYGKQMKTDEFPERLVPTAKSGDLSEAMVKEQIKWELEALEKKQEDRVSRLETTISKMKKQSDDNTKAIMEETGSEL